MCSPKLVVTLLAILTVSFNISVIAGCAPQQKSNDNSNSTSTSFVTPSGNIYCSLVGEDKDALRCEILSMLNPIPPLPNPGHCEFDWGAGFLLPRYTQPEILCISDTIAGTDYTLAYGSTWNNSGFQCESQTNGLTCTNSNNQGFFLSREKWNILQ